MEHDELDRLIRRIIETEDEEIDCGQVAELVARYVDLEVAGEAASQLLPKVRQHIGQCDTCAELYETLLELALLEDRNALPDADRLLDEIVAGGADDGSTVRPVTGAPPLTVLPHVGAGRPAPAEDRTQATDADTPTPEADLAWAARRARWGWWATAAALIAVIILGAWGQSRASEAALLRHDMEFIAHAERVIPMHGTESDPDASGHAFVGDGGERVLLVVDRLDPLPAERVYQLWLTTDSEDMISAGTFTVGPDGEGRIWTDLSSMPAGWASMFITPEPKGGSEQPTSKPVCVWGRAL